MTFDPLSFHTAAVETPSHESIETMRSLLVDTLEEHGVRPNVDAHGNVLCRRTGTEAGPELVLNTHIDTVGPHVPLEIEGTTVSGRGACDAKGPLAALVGAFLETQPNQGTLTLAVTPDEETDSLGANALSIDGDAYVVGEPTGLDVCTAARGRFEGTITVSGTNAHAADPTAGTNAVANAADVLGALESFDTEYGPGTHPTLGAPTLTPTMIEGGAAINQIPDECTIAIDRRTVPPETAETFERELNEHLGATGVDCAFALTDRPSPFLEAFATDREDPLVTALTAAGAGSPRPFEAATEAAYFPPAPTVVFGPGKLFDADGPVAHAAREYIEQPAITEATDILTRAIDSLLG